jgi:DNA-binding NarL/FixJ family response regulator
MTARTGVSEYSVLVVEDDSHELEAMREMLSALPDIMVLVAATLEEARQLARRHRPLLAIVDLSLPDGNGLTLVREFSREAEPAGRPPIACVVRTVFDTDAQVLEALVAGAQGYLVKGESMELTRQRIAAVLRGEPVVSPSIARRLLVAMVAREGGVAAPGVENEETLTAREHDVLRRIATGLTVAEVARELAVSDNTVKTHLKSVYRKLDVRSRAGVITVARDRGLL